MPAEIERVFLLRGMPVPMPEGVPLRIEQGYLPPSAGDALEGRVRRITHVDGRTEHVHTVKRGSGLVREEHERPMAADEFAREWPRTEGRRIAKVRTKVRVGDRTWEIDRFDGLPVVLAECELPSVEDRARGHGGARVPELRAGPAGGAPAPPIIPHVAPWHGRWPRRYHFSLP
jgi:CYTH domain-containing protein